MPDSFDKRQARIDALIAETQVDQIPVQKRLLKLAKIGMDDPSSLTSIETKQICFALVAHFYQMGIT